MFKLSFRGCETTTIGSVPVPSRSHEQRGLGAVSSRWHLVTVTQQDRADMGSLASRGHSFTEAWQDRADRDEGW